MQDYMRNKNTIKTMVALLIFIIIGLFFFLVFKREEKADIIQIQPPQQEKTSSLTDILQEQFDNKYKTIVATVGEYSVTLYTTSCPYGDSGDGTTCGHDSKQSPLIVIEDAKTKKVLSVFEVGFKNNSDIETGNNIALVDYQFTDDTFADFGFLTEWVVWWGGSSGYKGMAMFQKEGDKLLPVNGYFGETSPESNLSLTDKLTGETYSFPVITDSYFTSYDDLNKDGKTDLLYGKWKWDLQKESHYEARPWYLQVYELNINRFEVAQWWNNGAEYKTGENIGYEKKDKLRLLEIFNSVYKEK